MEGRFQGFIDHHTHAVSYGIKKTRIDLYETTSKEEALGKVRKTLESGEEKIIIAEDWDENKWKEKEFPTREELDDLSREVPIILRRICGHIAVCNTPAIERIPEKYKPDRESGIIYEDAVLYLNEIFPPTHEEIKNSILLMQEDFVKFGIVGINDIVLPEYHRAYTELDMEGKLILKVKTFVVDTHLDEIGSLKDTERVKLKGIKTFTDGSIGARTAAVEEFRYMDSEGNGLLLKGKNYLLELIEYAEEKKYSLAIHAIGDRAINEVLLAFREYGRFKGDHRIEHFELATDRQIEEAIGLDLIFSMQPNFIKNWSLSGGLYERAFGEKYRENNRIGLIHRRGGKILFGSDGMPYSPIYGIDSVINAPFEEQRIDMKTAFNLYTDDDAGGTEVVIQDNQVVETWIDGKCIYRREHA